jgi:hypothetical protein
MTKKTIFLSFFLVGFSAFACDEGFESFKNSVYLQVRRDCVRCHDGSKPTAPPFATSDPANSYNLLLNYMNFSKPKESLLVFRAGNNHCATSNCDEEAGAEMAENAQKWWESGENKCFRNGKYFTEEIEIPANLPSLKEGFMTLSFDLGLANDELKGTVFQIDIQNFSDATETSAGAYRFHSPRFTGGKGSLYFKDIKILLNGRYDSIYNAFSIENKKVNFYNANGVMATPVVSGLSMIISKDELQPAKLSVSFMEIQPAANDSCRNAAVFTNEVFPLLTKMNCATCHNQNGSSLGTQVFNLNRPLNQLCEVSSELANLNFPMSSALISVPTRGLYNHPQLTGESGTEYAKIIKNWLELPSKEIR